MARDYKHRANQTSQKRKKTEPTRIAWWKWLLIILLLALFIWFLVFLGNSTPEDKKSHLKKQISLSKKAEKSKFSLPKKKKQVSEEPRFDFYTILPETEMVVPDEEINIRSREEQFTKGTSKESTYLIQAGSFKDYAEADKLRARLALMGIESKVEKAKIGSRTWNRVKIGPYKRASSVSVIRKRLRQQNIDIIVTETKS